jgi:hypothetical protein
VLLQRHGEKLLVIDEIVLERATTEEACMEFENRYKGLSGGLEIYGDASGNAMRTTGISDYQTIRNYLYRAGFRNVKIQVPASNPAVLSRVRKVKAGEMAQRLF